jgi:hypothetical protein
MKLINVMLRWYKSLGFVVVAGERSIRSRTSTRRCPDLPAHYL